MKPMIDFGTKSETLQRLSNTVKASHVMPLVYFTQQQWLQDKAAIMAQIHTMLSHGEVIVRSSAINEDNAQSSMAGAFTSLLNINVADDIALATAIDKVIASFVVAPCKHNQVLVQPMLINTQMSGVVMTHDIQNGAPYYSINYDDESGKTDTITGGIGIQKTVLIYRGTQLGEVRSSRIKKLLLACQELEHIFAQHPLDIEFAIDNQEQVFILQVRRITLCHSWHPLTEKRVQRQLNFISQHLTHQLGPKQGVYGQTSMLGSMPDWNPAEIIGATPRPLASSLYRYVITDDIWLTAREQMGYFAPSQRELMQIISHHPYIDVRTSFNSFLPQNIAPDTAQKLVDAWIDKLRNAPELHDKVEFEVVHTCYEFDFNQQFNSRYPLLLTPEELTAYQHLLHQLTINSINGTNAGALPQALKDIAQLSQYQKQNTPMLEPTDLGAIKHQLQLIKSLGTRPFAIIARHAFIAENLLKSACKAKAITTTRLSQWKQSIFTVSSALTKQYAEVLSGGTNLSDFLIEFGHLRPSTYDITSLRYDERSDLFTTSSDPDSIPKTGTPSQPFKWHTSELTAIDSLLKDNHFDINTEQLFHYAKSAIEGREFAKFVFTRSLSNVLYQLERWGVNIGLSRDDLSFLDIQHILDTLTTPLLDSPDRIWLNKVNQAQIEYQKSSLLKLGHLIGSPQDVYVVPLHRTLPNFITQHVVSAKCFIIDANTPATHALNGKVICIENADPGYDWIFTKNIAGLITLYGGANSHMAIRCAEFGIPAAIGCGEQLFSQFTQHTNIVLNCRDKQLHKV